MNTAAPSLKIDFVSDIVCPWCAIGLSALEIALSRLEGEVAVQLHFQPFELHPDMGPEGAEVVPYLSKKYGMSAEQVAQLKRKFLSRIPALTFGVASADTNRPGERTHDLHRIDSGVLQEIRRLQRVCVAT